MISIKKDMKHIPASLNSNLTKQRRQEHIDANEYLKGNIYDSRYKMRDIKTALENLYNNKCGFCEYSPSQAHVEHFRPKADYWWLAYSWDNLIYACPKCNTNKGTHFSLLGIKSNCPEELGSIHQLSKKYSASERNQFVHPELEANIHERMIFDNNGDVKAVEGDTRMQYTIDTCKLNRKDLKDKRKEILDDLQAKINDRKLQYKYDKPLMRLAIGDLIRDFIRDSMNQKNNFLAFRRYAHKALIIKLTI